MRPARPAADPPTWRLLADPDLVAEAAVPVAVAVPEPALLEPVAVAGSWVTIVEPAEFVVVTSTDDAGAVAAAPEFVLSWVVKKLALMQDETQLP